MVTKMPGRVLIERFSVGLLGPRDGVEYWGNMEYGKSLCLEHQTVTSMITVRLDILEITVL